MKTPPFLLGTALLFWGWQTGFLPAAAALAAVIEAARLLTGIRWDLALKDMQRIAETCILIFFGTVMYRFTTRSLFSGDFLPLRWLPFSLFPIVMAQAYSLAGIIDVRSLRLILPGRQRQTILRQPAQPVSLTFPYLLVCVFAAAAANTRPLAFYGGSALLAAWAFLATRSRRYALPLWIALFVAAAGLGYVGQAQIYNLQRMLEENAALLDWLMKFRRDVDPYETDTAIGRIGRVKLENRVVCRVRALSELPDALLLREASYTTYKSSKWFAPKGDFAETFPEADDRTWKLGEESSRAGRLAVSLYPFRGKAVLKMPTGTFRLEHLLVGRMEINPYGAIKIDEGAALITYDALFDPAHPVDSPPNEDDLAIPADESPLFHSLASELGLLSAAPPEAARRVADFFQTKFSYSLDLTRVSSSVTPLADFLRASRAGHCEYFATATVLLLRAAGIPARYAVGYAVEDVSQHAWTVVRGRDGHAWALAYINGVWREMDTTPSSWRGFEARMRSPFEWLSDAWAKIKFALSAWRWGEQRGGYEPYLIAALVVLVGILGWRLYRRRRKSAAPAPQAESDVLAIPRPGQDSAFYLIERALQAAGFTRHEWESLSAWLARIEMTALAGKSGELLPLLRWHYRYRFDPQGLPHAERNALNAAVSEWLAAHSG